MAEAPPADPNGAPIISPTGELLISYSRDYWLAQIDATYSYGSTSPTLGFGPGEGVAVNIRGIPYPHKAWNNLAVLISGLADHGQFLQPGGTQSTLVFAAANVEARYSLNTWLGLVAGYNFHYASFGGVGADPPLTRNTVFAGVSGYFSNDKSLPTVETFSSPVAPM